MEVKQNASDYLTFLSELSNSFGTKTERIDLLNTLYSRLHHLLFCREMYCATIDDGREPYWFFAAGTEGATTPPAEISGAIDRTQANRQLTFVGDADGMLCVCPLLVDSELVGLLVLRLQTSRLTDAERDLVTVLSGFLALFLSRSPGAPIVVSEGQVASYSDSQTRKLTAIIELARSIAHELNQPLTGISGYCTLIKEAIGDDHVIAKDIDEIERQSARLENLVYRFQNITHIEYHEKDPDAPPQRNNIE